MSFLFAIARKSKAVKNTEKVGNYKFDLFLEMMVGETISLFS